MDFLLNIYKLAVHYDFLITQFRYDCYVSNLNSSLIRL